MNEAEVQISPGFSEDERALVAQLFWGAFKGKLGNVMGPEQKALALIARVLNPGFAIAARDEHGTLLGIAGYKTADGSLTGGSLGDVRAVYGLFGGLWRGLLLSVLEREIAPGVLVMDGIFVAPEARSRGVGGALLDAVCDEADRRGLERVRLDVIDNNPRAEALYLRKGFAPVGVEKTGIFRAFFGFNAATQMERVVSRTSPPPGPAA